MAKVLKVRNSANTGWEVIASNVPDTSAIASAAAALAVESIVDSAPSTLDTLNELAAALGDDANYATTVTNALSNKLNSNNPTITGTTSIQQVLEHVTISATAATSDINYDVLNNHAVTYYTSDATGNFTINFRGNSSTTLSSLMSVGQSLTVAFLVKNGSTGYYNTYISVDGQQIPYYWQGGSSPSANTNCIDAYTYTVIKNGSQADSFIVLASQTKFA